MKEMIEILMAIVWLFGSLCFWPIFKFFIKSDSYGVKWFKWQFWFNVFGLVFGFSLVQYYYFIGNEDWLHSLILPYAIGAISWIMAFFILVTIGVSSNCSKLD